MIVEPIGTAEESGNQRRPVIRRKDLASQNRSPIRSACVPSGRDSHHFQWLNGYTTALPCQKDRRTWGKKKSPLAHDPYRQSKACFAQKAALNCKWASNTTHPSNHRNPENSHDSKLKAQSSKLTAHRSKPDGAGPRDLLVLLNQSHIVVRKSFQRLAIREGQLGLFPSGRLI